MLASDYAIDEPIIPYIAEMKLGTAQTVAAAGLPRKPRGVWCGVVPCDVQAFLKGDLE